MKIYIVIENNGYTGVYIRKIYSTEEKAIEYRDELKERDYYGLDKDIYVYELEGNEFDYKETI